MLNRGIAIVALTTLSVLSSLAAARLDGLNVEWSLNLGLAPNPETGLVPTAHDDSNFYVADSRGVLFAVRASDGTVLWSAPGDSNVASIAALPEIADYIYVSSITLIEFGGALVNVTALRRTDGSVQGTLSNLNYAEYGNGARLAPISATRLAVLHWVGIMVVDSTLHPLWEHKHNFSSENYFWYNHVAANEHLVSTIYHNGKENQTSDWRVDSFDATTGAVRCSIIGVQDILNPFMGLDGFPFFISPSNVSLLWSVNMSEGFDYPGSPRLYDLNQCTVQPAPAGTFNDTTPQYAYFVAPDRRRHELLLHSDVMNGTLSIRASRISGEAAGQPAWAVHVALPTALIVPEALLMGPSPLEPSCVVVWFGQLLCLNASDGTVMWAINQSLPIAPPSNNGYFLFPLVGGRLLVPNLQGYSVVGADGALDVVVLDSPHLLYAGFTDGNRAPLTLLVGNDGWLTGVN